MAEFRNLTCQDVQYKTRMPAYNPTFDHRRDHSVLLPHRCDPGTIAVSFWNPPHNREILPTISVIDTLGSCRCLFSRLCLYVKCRTTDQTWAQIQFANTTTFQNPFRAPRYGHHAPSLIFFTSSSHCGSPEGTSSQTSSSRAFATVFFSPRSATRAASALTFSMDTTFSKISGHLS